MLPPLNGSTQAFLDGLSSVQDRMTDAQEQVSSGLRIRRASSDPFAVGAVLTAQSRIAQNVQAQANLDQVKTELQNADSALQQGVTAIERGIAIATQGASNSSDRFAELSAQAEAIQQQLVSISRTAVAGRYIFSGDRDGEPMYALDPSSPTGVRQLVDSPATRVVADGSGNGIAVDRTARDLLDPTDPAAGNVFAAINHLVVALGNRDAAGCASAADELKRAHDYLNQQLGLYGMAEASVADAYDRVARSTVAEKQRLSELRDADVAAEATDITQATLDQQAALGARAQISQLSLFNLLA